MSIDVMGEDLYEFEDEGERYKVSFLSNKLIFLYREGEIVQGFERPAHVDASNVASYFRDENVMKKSAVFGVGGITDKDRFMSEVDRLIKENKLKEEERYTLGNYISATDFPPETVKKQLIIKGYGRIGYEMEFETPSPSLVRSCKIFKVFLDLMQQYQKRKSNDVIQQSFQFHP